MKITPQNSLSKPSLEKLTTVTVHWTLLNEPSEKARGNFNQLLANVQLRVYRESRENK